MNANLDTRAANDWDDARRQLLKDRVVCFFRGCSVGMLSFSEAQEAAGATEQLERGLQEIPLARIKGSVGRFNDFSSHFLPINPQLKHRWQQVDMAMRQGKTPPIDVYQLAGDYYVVDGNHRVSVARQRGWETIPAHVTEIAAPVGEEETAEEVLLRQERDAFLARFGGENAEAAAAIRFTCAGCYNDLTDQIAQYHRQYLETWPFDMDEDGAFRAWKKEVYDPAVDAIAEHDMLAEFPDRTEADLFMWSWRNDNELG